MYSPWIDTDDTRLKMGWFVIGLQVLTVVIAFKYIFG